MTDTSKPKPPAKPTDPKDGTESAGTSKQSAGTESAGQSVDKPESAAERRARKDALRSELARLEKDDQGDPEPPEPTHRLRLSNGETVETSGAVPTHHTTDDGVFRVIDVETLDGTR